MRIAATLEVWNTMWLTMPVSCLRQNSQSKWSWVAAQETDRKLIPLGPRDAAEATHEPRAVSMNLCEPKSKAVPSHFQNLPPPCHISFSNITGLDIAIIHQNIQTTRSHAPRCYCCNVDFVLFHNITCCTNVLLSCVHVNTTYLLDTTCTLVATCVILGRPSTKCYFDEFLFMRGSSRMIYYNKSTVVRFQNAMVSEFCVRPTSKKWFLKIVQETMKHDPLDAM